MKKSVSPPSSAVVLGGNLVGNILEWYDFALYGSFATLFARLFFPPGNAFLSLLETFGAFAVGYVTRPIGGILFGHVGDTGGRKKALVWSILLMSIPTVLVGLLPTYQDAGMVSPVLLILLRMLQGIAIGGEFTLVMSFLVETAPDHRRGYRGSYALVGVVGGILLGTLSALATTTLLDDSDLSGWGWRIPFLMGILLTGAGVFLRRHLPESPRFLEREETAPPVMEAFREHWREMLKGFGFLITNSIAFYTIVVYQPSYLATLPSMNIRSALTIQLVGLVLLLFLIPLTGHLSDRVGRRPITLVSAAGFFFLSHFLYRQFQNGTPLALMGGQILFVVLLALYIGPLPSLMSEIFPSSVRCSALSFTFNTNLAIFGGTTPFVATWLTHHFHDRTAAGDYLSGGALISFVILITMQETRFKPMR
ncbi:MAG: MFS transporter [Leptospirales bacterium]